ncbi:MAG: hypothetical protein N3B18_05335 [Desulfobacterota bacterium]|nr:hypothetical protein [Thermodesulfobacteriota bacterium]
MGSYRQSCWRVRSFGYERAIQHIREAAALSRELGGTDEDVKQYFFTLPPDRLKEFFDAYEKEYGSKPREYAEITFQKWKSGKVKMSGMVAERLFNLLPRFMPLETKLMLIENLWRRVGPSSTKTYYVGTNVQLEDICRKVQEHLEQNVVPYTIPKSLEGRFNWLSSGDAAVKQQLLNFFRQKKKTLVAEALRTQLPILLDHITSEKGILTTYAAQTLQVDKHEVRIIVSKQVSGVAETLPAEKSHVFAWGFLMAVLLIFVLLCWVKM